MIELRKAVSSKSSAIATVHTATWSNTYRGILNNNFLDNDFEKHFLLKWNFFLYRSLTITIIILIQLIGNAKGQTIDAIYTIKLGADSVWIVSHEVTGIGIKTENGEIEMSLLFKNGKIDSTLLKETHLLAITERTQLATLLKKPNTLKKIEMAMCFMPQHAIVLKKGGKLYCIEVCFTCQRIGESDGLNEDFPYLDNRKWAELKRYFKRMGLKYELY